MKSPQAKFIKEFVYEVITEPDPLTHRPGTLDLGFLAPYGRGGAGQIHEPGAIGMHVLRLFGYGRLARDGTPMHGDLFCTARPLAKRYTEGQTYQVERSVSPYPGSGRTIREKTTKPKARLLDDSELAALSWKDRESIVRRDWCDSLFTDPPTDEVSMPAENKIFIHERPPVPSELMQPVEAE